MLSGLILQFDRLLGSRRIHLDGRIYQSDVTYQPSTIQKRSISEFCAVFELDRIAEMVPIRVVGITRDLVVEIVPDLVVEMVPDLVVEMVPDLVVEMVPARDVAETVRINVTAQEIDASFFIVLLLVNQNVRGTWSV